MVVLYAMILPYATNAVPREMTTTGVGAVAIYVELPGFVSDPLFVAVSVPVPPAEGVNVIVTGEVPFSVTLVAEKEPASPAIAGVTTAFVVPFATNVIVTGELIDPEENARDIE
jgi:hypothetical protein